MTIAPRQRQPPVPDRGTAVVAREGAHAGNAGITARKSAPPAAASLDLGIGAPTSTSDEAAVTPTLGERIRQRRAQFRREERRLVRERLSVAIAIALSWFAWSLPESGRRRLTDWAAAVYYRRARSYRENAHANLRQVLGPHASDAEVDATARRAFKVSALNFLDLILTPRRPDAAFVDSVRVVEGSWASLDAVLAHGKGAVMVSAHLGAFDHIGQAMHARGYRMTTVTGRTTSRFVFDGVQFLRRSRGADIVEATPSGVRRALKSLRRGDLCAIVTDRDFFENGRPVIFFGRPTTLPPGAVRIARDTGAPLVPAFARRDEHGYGFAIHPPIWVEKTSDIDADIDRGMAAVVAQLERAISRSPDQWVLFQPVWPAG